MEITGSTVKTLLGSEFSEQRKYQLAKVSLIRCGCPQELRGARTNVAQTVPIVIEKNRQKLGFVSATDYYPPSVIVAGAYRRNILINQGIYCSWAWVEKGALPIRDGDVMTAGALLEHLQKALVHKFYGDKPYIQGQAWPTITEVYPFAGRFLFSMRGQEFSQVFDLEPDSHGVRLPAPAMALRACGGLQMSPNQTGARYAYAPVRTSQHVSYGGKDSELITQAVRNWSNINEAVNMYLDAVKHGLHKPMKPAFAPVSLSDTGKIMASLQAANIAPADFAIWSLAAQEKKTKSHGGDEVPMSKHAFVGDPADKSTWHLPIDTPGRAQNALSRVNQTQNIPKSAKPGVLQKIRRAASKKGVEVSDKPTPGQKQWVGHKVAAEIWG